MVKYNLLIKPSALKEIKQLSKKELARITQKIRELAETPRPMNSEKLSAKEQYRIRQGDYRILYSIDDVEKTVIIVKIAHRREVYR
ncbi:MAG: type II toxin-antitoxin system RelE/ParE family toxin [Deltaproteobacteria bacterium]|nr:type II toxin-antitoxin system RelE/ParE family toxin [Deltaproteobacteria bacterium]